MKTRHARTIRQGITDAHRPFGFDPRGGTLYARAFGRTRTRMIAAMHAENRAALAEQQATWERMTRGATEDTLALRTGLMFSAAVRNPGAVFAQVES